MTHTDELNRLRTEYSSKSDDELLLLAEDMSTLTEAARLALAEAIMKRGLQLPEPRETQQSAAKESVPDTAPLVTVRWFGNVSDAYPAKSRLDSAGIQSFLADQNMGRLFSIAVGGVKLQVRSEDAASATEILDSEFPVDETYSE
jgi:hypothetical protein